jgi:glycosyltransferase involved in cell wall biosynthesis
MAPARETAGTKTMRIAQVAPLYESVPPRTYGGTERVVSYLTEALVDAGHEVTLFASGDSQTRANLVPCYPRALRLDPAGPDSLALHLVMLEDVFRRRRDFDIVHWHIDYLHFPLSSRTDYARLTTLHGRLDLPELQQVYGHYPREPVVSISDHQRTPLPQAQWVDTVYHGLPRDLHRLHTAPEDYLVIVGRISPEKRMDRAIEIALRAGMRLVIAAKVDKHDQEYFEQVLQPLLRRHQGTVEFVGEVGEAQRGELVSRAGAFLFPIDWPEPFGMVMIEALSVGTPVVAWRNGSVPEVLDEGRTGFIVDAIEAAAAAVPRALELDRAQVRAVFEQRFTADRMAARYLELYEQLGAGGPGPAVVAAGAARNHPA